MWALDGKWFPDWVPVKYGASVAKVYQQYLDERERDIREGREPATDDVQKWEDFVLEYVYAELEAAE